MGVGGGHITADCKQRKEGRGAFYGESQALGEGGGPFTGNRNHRGGVSRKTATKAGRGHFGGDRNHRRGEHFRGGLQLK